MIVRSISGILLVSVILASLFLQWFPFFWFFIICYAFKESYRLNDKHTISAAYFWSSIVTLSCYLTAVLFHHGGYVVDGFLLGVLVFVFSGMLSYRTDGDPLFFDSFSKSFFLYFYPTVFFGSLLYIFLEFSNPSYWVLYLFVVMWLQDTLAYFCGKAIGRTPFSPHLSPKKTWEGSVLGLGLTVVLLWMFVGGFPNFFPENITNSILFYTVLVGIAGQLGDLLESLLKRVYGKKDSGKLIPGHGGVLDRFDSVTSGALVVLAFQVISL